MSDPVASAAEAFLAIYNNLPSPILALCNLAFIVLFVSALIALLWHLR